MGSPPIKSFAFGLSGQFHLGAIRGWLFAFHQFWILNVYMHLKANQNSRSTLNTDWFFGHQRHKGQLAAEANQGWMSAENPFPNGLLLEQQGWKFVSSKYKWLENAHQARFGSNWLLWNGKNQLKKKIAEKKIFLEIFWTTRDCMEFQSRVIMWPCGIVWIFNPWWSKKIFFFFF